MKCPLCGKEYEGIKICPSCNLPLIDTETKQAVSLQPEKKHKKKNRMKENSDKNIQPVLDSTRMFEEYGKESKAEETETKIEAEKPEEGQIPDVQIEAEKEQEKEDVYGNSFGDINRNFQEPAKENSSSNKVTISFNPFLVAGGAVLLLLLVALIFIVKSCGKNDSDSVEPQSDVYVESYPEPEEPIGQTEEKTEEVVDMSEVDLDAYNASYVQIEGCLLEEEGSSKFTFETPLNIYLEDRDAGKAVVVRNIDGVKVEDTHIFEGGDYTNRKMLLECRIWRENGEVQLYPETIIQIEPMKDDVGIHEYGFVIEDCTWEEACQKSMDAGGYLVRINSEEEYEHIKNLLNAGGYTDIHFYLGGKRTASDTTYYWVNQENQFIESGLNPSDSWAQLYWYNGEPSFVDVGSEATGTIEEDVMNLFCVSGSWYLNDSSANLAGMYPDLLSGKVGYIVEYE